MLNKQIPSTLVECGVNLHQFQNILICCFVAKRESDENMDTKNICSRNYCYSLQKTSKSNLHSEKAVRGGWGLVDDGTTRLITNTFNRL